MAMWCRIGNGLLLVGGLALAALMAYTLSLDIEGTGWVGPSGAADVAVVLPDRANWHDFRKGIWTCDRQGLVHVVRDETDAITVETPSAGGRSASSGNGRKARSRRATRSTACWTATRPPSRSSARSTPR